MRTVLHISAVGGLPDEGATSCIAALKPEEFVAHNPDMHLVLLDNGTIRARCSLWWSSVPLLDDKKAACIGHYAAMDAADSDDLLDDACRTLVSNKAEVVIGPVDGNTWHRYRLITGRGDEPPFFLEPDNPDTYPRYFEAAGFSPLARYYSSLNDHLERSVNLPDGLLTRLVSEGVVIRQLDAAAFMAELSLIHEISVAGFRNNFLYSPISREEFIDMYAKVQPYVHPQLVLFAEVKGQPIGFIFAVPDMLCIQSGRPADTVILKSMAVVPEWNSRGIGAWLLAEVTKNAHQLGFRRAIHALMHENNRSRSMSGHYGHEIRQYTLFSRNLS